ncbi:RNA polymerase III subunit C17 [Spraguea lophii 42_110]|uniref:DNA-directed RNA polymerase III subunit RPC9 n=1 Tax=Spraguea lophii (strain 42_110) TaxID=1358809 RepID=S7XTB0_SPRLO|nr:RNA polymerase III subunit C17 [Spraguea lophii 42_110]
MKIVEDKNDFLTNNEILEIFGKMKESKNTILETMRYSVNLYCSEPSNIVDLEKYNLYPLEKFQLLNNNPKSLLCLQLIIEEMEERFTEEELEEILNLFIK